MIPRISILAAVVAASACAGSVVRPAPFRARPDSVAQGDLRGPFDGRVVDGETDRPVPGALVYASWSYVSGFGLNAPAGFHEFLGSTDANGYYKVPRWTATPGSTRLADFHLIIYKRGYVAYRSDRRFEDFGPRTDFTQRQQVVELLRWRSDFSHVRHLRYIGGGPTLTELTAWEVADAAQELSGQRGTQVASAGPLGVVPGEPAPSSQPVMPLLHADRLLRPDDIKSITGFDGPFDVSPLGDEPTTPEYDSAHLQARGKDESYDVAIRVWRKDPAEADKQYERLLAELPGAQQKNEMGDRSLRAGTPKGEILAVGFLELRRGVVALVTCGGAQCRTPEDVVKLAKIVRERAVAAYPVRLTP